jgi:hypothetical protein
LERTRISGPVAHFTGLPAPASQETAQQISIVFVNKERAAKIKRRLSIINLEWGCCEGFLKSFLGIGIEADAAGIGIPASSISVRHRSIPVPDWDPLIPVLDSPAFRHLTKLHEGTSTEGSSVRL